LDEGDPVRLAADHRALEGLLPNLSIVGGCCGTDSRHVAELWSGKQ
jgi:homocysteine S-methyltransferase